MLPSQEPIGAEWWADAPDDYPSFSSPFPPDGWERERSIYDPRHVYCAPAPSGLKIPRVDTTTNARIKCYLTKEVVQVANDDIFPTGDFELQGLAKKRGYDVSPPGKALDPERSLEESKRRARSKVRDISLCNRFTHMFTWTLDPEMVNRYDAKAVYQKVRNFLSNATRRKNFSYVVIPEYHKIRAGEDKPAIHMHGLCTLGDVRITPSVRKNGTLRKTPYGQQIFNMEDWRLGFSTCVPLDANYERAVNYVTKYITKSDNKIFGKWYLSSRALTKSPDIIPLERVDFEGFRDPQKLERKEQTETSIYLDVKIVSEEVDRSGVSCFH